MGHARSPSRSSATPATARRRRRPAARCAGSTRTRAGSGCSTAGRRSTAARASAPGDRVFFPFSFGPFLGFWAGFEAGCQIGLHCVPGGGMSSQLRLAHDRRGRRDRRLLHADLRAAAGGGGRRGAAGAAARGEQRPRADRRGRAGRQHPGDARAHRAELGRARHRSPRADRSRAGQLRVLGVARVAAPQRGRVHLRGARPGRPATRCRTGSRASWSSRTSAGRPARSSATAPATSSSGARSRVPCGRTWARLEGGILARADDMVNIRGVNVYPAGIESVVRRFPEVVEFRSTVSQAGAMRSLTRRDRGGAAGRRPRRRWRRGWRSGCARRSG